MKFWDTSAIIALLIEETHSARAHEDFRKDRGIMVWTLTIVECYSVVSRLQRTQVITAERAALARKDLGIMEHAWTEIEQVDLVKRKAERLLSLHTLHAADACQLAAALIACEDRPSELDFVTFDDQLAKAALREGFVVSC